MKKKGYKRKSKGLEQDLDTLPENGNFLKVLTVHVKRDTEKNAVNSVLFGNRFQTGNGVFKEQNPDY